MDEGQGQRWKSQPGSGSEDAQEEDALMSVAMAARLLGVSEKTVRLLAKHGDLKHYRIGRRLKISRKQVQAFLDRVEEGRG